MKLRAITWAALAAWTCASQIPAPKLPELPKGSEPGGVFKIDRYSKEEAAAPAKQEEPKEIVLENTGKPLKLPFTCPESDIAGFGMTCTEKDPCPVFLELAAVQPLGVKIFVTGNLHNGASTMYSVLVTTEDGGKTWREPYERIRSAGLDQIQFLDFETGWISGQVLLAMPRDPFFLLTTDGGKSWRKRPVFGESRVAAIEQFHFESKTQGSLIVDRTQGAETPRYEHHDSMTGGESWTVKEVSGRALRLKVARNTTGNADWRIESDGKTKSHRVEKKEGGNWNAVVRFESQVGECKPALAALPEPPPPPDPVVQAPPPSPGRRPSSGAPALKKKR